MRNWLQGLWHRASRPRKLHARPEVLWPQHNKKSEEVLGAKAFQEALRALKASEKTDIDVSMNHLAHTFTDASLERNYVAFFAVTYHRKMLGMWVMWALLAATILLRAHAVGVYSWDSVLMVYGVFAVSGLGSLALWKWERLERWLPRAVDAQSVVTLGSSAVMVLTFVALDLDLADNEGLCRDDDPRCFMDVNYGFGFLGGLMYVGFGLFFVGAIPNFAHFFFLATTLASSYIAVFVVVDRRGSKTTSWVLMVFIYLALLWSHRSHDLFLRRQYLWFSDTVRLTQDHLKQLDAAKEHKERVVGYLFHEVRNPMNDIVLATALALDMLRQDQQPPQPGRSQQPPQPGRSQQPPQPGRSQQPPQPGQDQQPDQANGSDPQRPNSAESDPQPEATPSESSHVPSTPCESGGDVAHAHEHAPSNRRHSAAAAVVHEDQLTEMLQVVHQSAEAASRVLDDALDLQKLEVGTFAFVRETFCVREMFDPVVKALGPRFAAKQLEVGVEVEAGLGELYVQGDLKRLRQVVHNFLSNALKFTPAQGRVVVRASQPCNLTPRRVQVRVAVSDTGIGLRADDQARMFAAWSQIRAAQTQAGGGTGLGLALSKDFIEKGHSGTIGCASPGDLGPGSTFFFVVDFPLGAADHSPRPLGPRQPTRVAKGGGEHEEHEGREGEEEGEGGGVDVLVVDDSATTRRLVGRFLTSFGLSFDEAGDGQQALEKATQQRFRLILMDKEMPVMDGFAATKAIRALDPTVPIVGVTGNALDHQRRDFMACGATLVVSKPIGKAGLLDVLRRFHLLE